MDGTGATDLLLLLCNCIAARLSRVMYQLFVKRCSAHVERVVLRVSDQGSWTHKQHEAVMATNKLTAVALL